MKFYRAKGHAKTQERGSKMKTTKTYTTTSREYIYTGFGDEDVRPGVDAEIWYEGEDSSEALRIAAKNASGWGKAIPERSRSASAESAARSSRSRN